jgi:hypothetical protein
MDIIPCPVRRCPDWGAWERWRADLGLAIDQSDKRRHGIPETGRGGGEDVGLEPVSHQLGCPAPRLLVAVLFGDLGHPPVGLVVIDRTDLKEPVPGGIVGGMADPEQDVAGVPRPTVIALFAMLPAV